MDEPAKDDDRVAKPAAGKAAPATGGPAKGAPAKPATAKAGGGGDEGAGDLFERFKACAVEVLQVDEERVTVEATFAELEADSLDLVELVMALEEAFDITVDEQELDGVETVGQAFTLVTSKI